MEFKHTQKLKGVDLELKDVAVKIGDLYYDSMAELLHELSEKLTVDGNADLARGRKKLANELFNASENIKKAAENIEVAWEICKPAVERWEEKYGSNRVKK